MKPAIGVKFLSLSLAATGKTSSRFRVFANERETNRPTKTESTRIGKKKPD